MTLLFFLKPQLYRHAAGDRPHGFAATYESDKPRSERRKFELGESKKPELFSELSNEIKLLLWWYRD